MKLTAPEEGPLLELLQTVFSATPTRIRKMIKNGMIMIDGRRATRSDVVVKAGQTIEYHKAQAAAHRQAPVPVVFDDPHLMVVDKPPGLLTYGERGTGGTSLYRMLKAYLSGRTRAGAELFVVHRLDREVSGLVLFAKRQKIQEQLKLNWSKTRKLYYALVEGLCPEPQATIQSWLVEGPDRRMSSGAQSAQAKWAVTHYRVLRRLAAHTLLEIELTTGRKNQIRVHLAEAGYPVVGDRRYGADARVKRRIRLHAYFLAFRHPAEGIPLHFELPMPDGFLTLGDHDETYK